MPLFSRIENAVVSYVIYIKQMFYPVGLELPYFNPPGGFPAWEVIACPGRCCWEFPLPRFCIGKRCPVLHCWLALVSGNDVTSHRFGADLLLCAGRSLHLPPAYRTLPSDSMGSRRSDSRAGLGVARLLTFAGLLVIGLLVMQARVQASYWHDSEKLWRYEIVVRPITLLPALTWDLFLMRKGRWMLPSRSMKRRNEYSRLHGGTQQSWQRAVPRRASSGGHSSV